MQVAYREITDVINHKVNITVPEYINTDRVEIIIIPYTTPKTKTASQVDFNQYFGVSNIGVSKIENYLKNVRNEWDREIPD